MRLDGRSALVTGGASGIGEASAIAFADVGASVIVADRDERLGREVAAGIRSRGGTADFVAADVTCEDAVRAMVDFALARFGRLDCAVNSAGIANRPTPITDLSAEEWRRVWEIDTLGMALCLKHQIAAMRAGGAGSIVNIASGAGLFGSAGMGPYVTAKFGVVGLTKTAALEYAAEGIRVNAVCPGLIDTPLTSGSAEAGVDWSERVRNPMGRLGRAHEIADVALWLASDRSSYVTGQAISADGGLYAG